MTSVAVLGAGTMGEAILTGLLAGGTSPGDVVVTARRPERAEELAARHGVRVVPNGEAAAADTLVLAVKPGDMGQLVDSIAEGVRPAALVISVAAGLPTRFFESRLPNHAHVVRVMPNTPVVVGEAMCIIAAGRHVAEEHLVRVEAMFAPVGRTVRVPEAQIDAATALAGSGPAYHFLFVEAMIEAGVLMGLPRKVARELAVQTAFGSAKLLRDSGSSATELREQVTSPGGTTIAALRELESHGLRGAVFDALEAARDRGRELGEAYS